MRDAHLVDRNVAHGDKSCLAALVAAGATVRQLRENSVIPTARMDALVVDQRIHPLLPTREVAVTVVPKASTLFTLPATRAQQRPDLLFDAGNKLVLLQPAVADKPQSYVVLDTATGQTSIFQAPAGDVDTIKFDGRGVFVIRDSATGDFLSVDVENNSNIVPRPLSAKTVDGTPLTIAYIGAADAEKAALVMANVPGAPGDAYLTRWDLKRTELVFRPAQHFRAAPAFALDAVVSDGDNIVVGFDRHGIDVANDETGECVEAGIAPDGAVTCRRVAGAGRVWSSARNGTRFEMQHVRAQKWRHIAVGLKDGATLPLEGCTMQRAFPTDEPAGFRCDENFRVFRGETELRVRIEPTEHGMQSVTSSIDVTVTSGSTDVAPLLIDHRTMRAYALPPGTPMRLVRGAWGQLATTTGISVYDVDQPGIVALSGLQPPPASDCYLVASRDDRAVFQCSPLRGETGGVVAVMVVNPRTGAAFTTPGSYFGETPTRILLTNLDDDAQVFDLAAVDAW